MSQSLSFAKEARPFVLHLVLIFLSVIVLLCVIDNDDRVYNLDHRRPHFTDLNGSQRVDSIRNTRPLQSDITTMLSLLASATRAAAAWWAGKFLWRCAFMFMEKGEIALAGFSKVVSGGIATLLSPRHVSSRKNWLLVYAIIFTCFAMDYFSAILTGSVTWELSFTLVDGVVPLTDLTEGVPGTDLFFYKSRQAVVLQDIEYATYLAIVSWGIIDTDSADLPVPSNLTRRAIIQDSSEQGIAYLPPNSTLGTIRVPYFKVEEFEYITDPESTLTSHQWSLLNDTSPYNPFLVGSGYVGLFPDDSWGPDSSPTLPTPIQVSESRILGIRLESPIVPSCKPPKFAVPQNISPYLTTIINGPQYSCFIFANVTYTAGAAICEDCQIVSPLVVEGDIDDLQPIPDPITNEVLAVTSSVATHIYQSSFATPVSDSSTTLQDFAIETLSRAYQCTWSSLVFYLGDVDQNYQTSVMVAVNASHPNVVRWRVYLWATLHIAVLLGGIAFVYFQSRSTHPWVSDHITEAFLLDTTGIFKQGEAANNATDPWHPGAEYPAGKLKLNDHDPERPGQPRTVVLMPTRTTPPSSPQQFTKNESDIFPT